MLQTRLLAAFVLLFGLASCTTLSEEECLTADWYQIGARDGAEGRGTDHIDAHRRACARADVTPDTEAWLKGRDRGLRLYCTPQKAYEVAREGGTMRSGCTTEEMERLQAAYDWGREYWRLELQIRDLESEIRQIDRDLAVLPPVAGGGRSHLFAERMLLRSRLSLLRAQQRRYATWP